MGLTTGSHVFTKVTLEMVAFIASCANLRMYVCDWAYQGNVEVPSFAERGRYWKWEDSQTGGGGARIVMDRYRKVAWVSRHSGYPQADKTEEVAELFRELGAYEVSRDTAHRLKSPGIYDFRESTDSLRETGFTLNDGR